MHFEKPPQPNFHCPASLPTHDLQRANNQPSTKSTTNKTHLATTDKTEMLTMQKMAHIKKTKPYPWCTHKWELIHIIGSLNTSHGSCIEQPESPAHQQPKSALWKANPTQLPLSMHPPSPRPATSSAQTSNPPQHPQPTLLNWPQPTIQKCLQPKRWHIYQNPNLILDAYTKDTAQTW